MSASRGPLAVQVALSSGQELHKPEAKWQMCHQVSGTWNSDQSPPVGSFSELSNSGSASLPSYEARWKACPPSQRLDPAGGFLSLILKGNADD